jgi:hypothetical protein
MVNLDVNAYAAIARYSQAVPENKFRSAATPNLPDAFRPLEGDQIRVLVMAQKDNNVVFRTADGEILSAKYNGDPLPPGQLMDLTVTQSGPLTLTLEAFGRRSVQLDALLESFGASSSQANIALATEMIRQGATMTGSAFQRIQAVLSAFRSLSVEQAVFMTSHDIPVNAQTVPQFKGFLDHRNLLGEELAKLLSLFEDPTTTPSPADPIPSAQNSIPPETSKTESPSPLAQETVLLVSSLEPEAIASSIPPESTLLAQDIPSQVPVAQVMSTESLPQGIEDSALITENNPNSLVQDTTIPVMQSAEAPTQTTAQPAAESQAVQTAPSQMEQTVPVAQISSE